MTGFSLEELDDDELFDFFLSTGGNFSSFGLSGLGTIGSVVSGFSGSNISDFLLEELDEDFLLLGDLTSGSTTFGDSGFLISSLLELDSESFSGGITGSAGSFDLLSLEELDDDDFGDLGFSTGGNLSDSLESSGCFGSSG